MRATCTAMAAMAAAWLVLPAAGEVPPLKEEVRTKEATHILEGKVAAIQSKVRQGDREGFVDTVYTFEIEVAKVDKGDGVKVGDTVKATTWKVKERPKGLVGPGGQYVIPEKGSAVRVYLRKDKEGDGYTLLLPNGLDVKRENKDK